MPLKIHQNHAQGIVIILFFVLDKRPGKVAIDFQEYCVIQHIPGEEKNPEI
jgi:hypothetical protein